MVKVKAKMVKVTYLLVALALMVSLLPLSALPVSATVTLSPNEAHNVIGAIERFTLTGGPTSGVVWQVGNAMPGTDAQIVGTPTQSTVDVQALTSGQATVEALSGTTILASAVKKWGQIDKTVITPPQSKAVIWDEEWKTLKGSATITDVVIGTFIKKNSVTQLWTDLEKLPADGALLNWFLIDIHEEGNIPMGPADPDDLVSAISQLDRSRCVTFTGAGRSGATTQTVSGDSDAIGTSTVTVSTVCEEAVVVVVVPDYPVENNHLVVTEVTKVNFYTIESEKVPQVRWAGEKIVLEKCFGPNNEVLPARFSLENQSPGSLEGLVTPVPFNYGNTSQTVWTITDGNGCARVILISEAPGEVDVDLALYSTSRGDWLINQHGFVVFFLKLEGLTLGNVEGKRTGHKAGLWVSQDGTPYNVGPYTPAPTTADLAFDSKLTADMLQQTLNVSQDALLRARVKGWFVGDNLSGRPARCQDTDPQVDGPINDPADSTKDCDIMLPAGRWVLPDDWPALAGPDWKEHRIHWDIMDQPNDDVMSAPGLLGELGEYRTTNYHTAALVPGALVAVPLVVGPFNPAWELPTPTGYDPGLHGPFKTVVPNKLLNWWDAPMPPAKITFKIKSGPGFFKETKKTDIYYHGDTHAGIPPIVHIHYTNPFYWIMVPATSWIPAMVNNGGYDWDSWDLTLYGPYELWFIMNRPPNAEKPSSDPANFPTKVQVYSDNHGEAMAYLNGDWNLVLTNWLTNGAFDIKPGTQVGTTEVTVNADYPYFRKHPSIFSNPVTKTWTWGKEILGTDPATYPDGTSDPALTARPRMVLQVGTLVAGKSDKKMAFVWVTDRDGLPVYNERITWMIQSTASGITIPDIDSPLTAPCGVSTATEIMENICVDDGFLRGTKGKLLNPLLGESYTKEPNSWEVKLFEKFWGPGLPGGDKNARKYGVAAVELISSLEAKVDLVIILHEREGDIVRHTNLDWAVADSPDDPVLLLRGDANNDTFVNMGDVTQVERMILALSARTLNADVDGNGVVDMGDVIKIERIILGLGL